MSGEFRYINFDTIIKGGKYPFTKGQIRQFLMDRKENGLSSIIKKIGKRLYVREDLFDKWIDEHNDSGH